MELACGQFDLRIEPKETIGLVGPTRRHRARRVFFPRSGFSAGTIGILFRAQYRPLRKLAPRGVQSPGTSISEDRGARKQACTDLDSTRSRLVQLSGLGGLHRRARIHDEALVPGACRPRPHTGHRHLTLLGEARRPLTRDVLVNGNSSTSGPSRTPSRSNSRPNALGYESVELRTRPESRTCAGPRNLAARTPCSSRQNA